MSRAREVMKQVSLYAGASYITQFLAVIAGIVTRNILGPYLMGVWATVQLVMSYCDYSGLGIDAALSREYPYCIGKGDRKGADRIRDLVTSFGLVTAAAASGLVLIVVFVSGGNWPSYLFWGLAAAPLMLLTQRFSNTIIGWLRASKQFELASAQIVLSGVMNLALILALASWLKFFGFLLAVILSYGFNVAFLLKKSSFKFSFRLDREVFRLVGFGLPLLALSLLFELLRSIDKMIVIKYLGFEQMGIYGVATMAAMLVAKIPDSIVIVLIPHFHEKFGEREDAQDLRSLVDRSALAYTLIMPLVIGVAWILASPAVAVFLPEFTASIPALKALLLSTYFFALCYPYSNFLIAVKRHFVLFPIIIVALLIQGASTLAVIRFGYGLIGVACVAIFCYFLTFSGLCVVAARDLYRASETAARFLLFAGIFAAMTAALLVIDALTVSLPGTARAALGLSLLLVFSIPVLYRLNKEFAILGHIREFMTKRTGE